MNIINYLEKKAKSIKEMAFARASEGDKMNESRTPLFEVRKQARAAFISEKRGHQERLIIHSLASLLSPNFESPL